MWLGFWCERVNLLVPSTDNDITERDKKICNIVGSHPTSRGHWHWPLLPTIPRSLHDVDRYNFSYKKTSPLSFAITFCLSSKAQCIVILLSAPWSCNHAVRHNMHVLRTEYPDCWLNCTNESSRCLIMILFTLFVRHSWILKHSGDCINHLFM